MRYFWFAVYLGTIGYVLWWLVGAVRQRAVHEVYAAVGIGLCFTEALLGGYGPGLGLLLARVAGFALFVPAAVLVILGFITLHRVGRPRTGWEATTTIIQTGVFGLTRHPVFFGTALWSVALLLVHQSLIAGVLTPVVVFCLYRASVGDETATRAKFGAEYDIYCRQVPRWNIIVAALRLLRNR